MKLACFSTRLTVIGVTSLCSRKNFTLCATSLFVQSRYSNQETMMESVPDNGGEEEDSYMMHPVNNLWNEYKRTPMKEQPTFNFEPHTEFFQSFIMELGMKPTCTNLWNPKRPYACTCLLDPPLEDEEVTSYCYYMAEYSTPEGA